jgi:hypothetical protein
MSTDFVACQQRCLQVPNLFPKDELVTIMEMVTARAKKSGRGLTPQVGARMMLT